MEGYTLHLVLFTGYALFYWAKNTELKLLIFSGIKCRSNDQKLKNNKNQKENFT